MSTNRYSDKDLNEFKSIIDSKLKEAKEDLLNLKLSSDDKFFISLANKYKNINK